MPPFREDGEAFVCFPVKAAVYVQIATKGYKYGYKFH